MNYYSITRIFLITLFSLFVNILLAQNNNNDLVINQWASKPLAIDGKLEDWGDSLKYLNDDTRFSFEIRNDDKTLYVAIKSIDKQNLNRILARGITFSVNPEGKKKTGATIVFPVIDRSITNQAAKEKGAVPEDKVQIQKEIISKITKFNVSGFAEIIDGAVSLNNTYGISAAANFDERSNFVMEFEIPLTLLNISPAQPNIACLFQINGIKQPRTPYDPNRNSRVGMYGYPSRDYGYDRRPAVNKQNLSAGFWVKSTLATNIKN